MLCDLCDSSATRSSACEISPKMRATMLEKVQRGEQPDDFKSMPSIGKGVEEIRATGRQRRLSRDLRGRARRGGLRAACVSKENANDLAARYRNRQEETRTTIERWEMRKPESYASVWDAIADMPGQAANLRARAELMRQIAAFVNKKKWTQVEAAKHCGVTQPRINDLLRGRVSRFSLDALVNISTALGCRVRVDLDAA